MSDLSRLSDSVLTVRIKTSDVTAFRELFNRYYMGLYQFVRTRTHSREETEDLLQDVFTRIWLKRRELNRSKSIRALLYRIALDYSTDFLRRRIRRPIIHVDSKHCDCLTCTDSFGTEIMTESVISLLPESVATVFVMNRFEGFSYAEIAAVCGISVRTVGNRMRQALRILGAGLRND
jgi:RNA polymerase sigma-70 factor (ECF subfamily)